MFRALAIVLDSASEIFEGLDYRYEDWFGEIVPASENLDKDLKLFIKTGDFARHL